MDYYTNLNNIEPINILVQNLDDNNLSDSASKVFLTTEYQKILSTSEGIKKYKKEEIWKLYY